MKLATIAVAALLAAGLLTGAPALADEKAPGPAPRPARPAVEVMFVLDTTGSMGGLIEGAKLKIWKIVNQIVSGDPVPDLRVGLVAYRDRKDAYVTQITPLTADLDKVYGILRGFKANGGGDAPESVNEALHVALTRTHWSRDARTLRIIYLVGDAPPHMDYQDDVKFPVTCEAAARAGILINTVQCGGNAGTTQVWKRIADLSEGKFFQIQQSGGMRAVVTPYDGRLAELGRKLSGGAVMYGKRRDREVARKALDDAEKDVAAAPGEAGAERAGYLAKSGRVGAMDLLGKLESKSIKLEDIDEEKLPKDLREMKPEARKVHLDKLLKERAALRSEMKDLDAKRAVFIKDAMKKSGDKGDAFDAKVVESLKEQAKKVGITYDEDEK